MIVSCQKFREKLWWDCWWDIIVIIIWRKNDDDIVCEKTIGRMLMGLIEQNVELSESLPSS